MGHPNKRAVRQLRCYESIHENTSLLFVHVIPHSCKSVILFTCLSLFTFTSDNYTKANDDKCRVLLSINEYFNLNTDTVQVQNSSSKKLLKVEIVCKPNFKDRIGSICKKACVKPESQAT